MKEYIEKVLHQEVQVTPYKEVQKLPLVCRNGYTLSRLTINGQEALAAEPTTRTVLTDLRKHHHQMEVYTGLVCVLYLKEMNYYSRDTMLKEGIPFVWEGHQVYLPYIGVLLDDQRRQAVASCHQISWLTQKLLLTALYEGWKKMNVSRAAELLGVAKMSITRCYDELEALDIPYLSVKSRARQLTADPDKKTMWDTIRPVLRNPVMKKLYLRQAPVKGLPVSGTMALAHYSRLDEGSWPVYAVTKKELASLMLTDDILSPAGETPGCAIQELGYQIRFGDGRAVDPLTVALSLTEEELADPRINMAADEMLEEYVW